MTFQEQLNLYIEELSCSGRELAKNSGISETILSRFFFGSWKSMYPKWHLPCTMIRPIFPRSEQEKEHPQMSGA